MLRARAGPRSMLFVCLLAIASLLAFTQVSARSSPSPVDAVDARTAFAVDSLPDVSEFRVVTIRLSESEAIACGVVDLADGRVGVTAPALQLRHANTGHTLITYIEAAVRRCETPLRQHGITITSRERYDVHWRIRDGTRLQLRT